MKYILCFFISLNLYAETASFKYPVEFIFTKVLEYKNIKLKKAIPFPQIYLEGQTSLKQFQDAIESQWGMRPDIFTNAFSINNNEIYLLDDANYYKKHNRCIDDSLAHELAHYIQSKYQGWDLDDESLEWDAIDTQNYIREHFCKIN